MSTTLPIRLLPCITAGAVPNLLDTHDADQRHVALVNSAQSIKNGIQIFKMLKTFGLNHSDIEVARANLYKSIDDPHQKLLIDKGIQGQLEHFDNASFDSSIQRLFILTVP